MDGAETGSDLTGAATAFLALAGGAFASLGLAETGWAGLLAEGLGAALAGADFLAGRAFLAGTAFGAGLAAFLTGLATVFLGAGFLGAGLAGDFFTGFLAAGLPLLPLLGGAAFFEGVLFFLLTF